MPLRLLSLALLLVGAWYIYKDASSKGRPILGATIALAALVFPLIFLFYWLFAPKLLKQAAPQAQTFCSKCGTAQAKTNSRCKNCGNTLNV